jgi:hypothetical protein
MSVLLIWHIFFCAIQTGNTPVLYAHCNVLEEKLGSSIVKDFEIVV